MADQLTAAMTGAYGHPLVRTPALNDLAESGVRFDAAYTPCPLCTPARSAMFSGRYVSRTRTYDNGSILPADVPTFAHHLRAGGYEVVASGKLHFVGADQLHGLERRLTPDIYPADFEWTPTDPDDAPPDDVSSSKAVRARNAGPVETCEQIEYDDNAHAEALRFLGGGRDANRPFCLLMSYSHPHPPYLAARRLWDSYDGIDIPLPPDRLLPADERSVAERWVHFGQGISPADAGDDEYLRRIHRAYYAMITYVDEKLAELIAALATTGLADDTAVLFASDHGDMLGRRRQLQKRLMFEPSAQIPLIGSFPGRWARGAAIDAPVSLLDVLPTLAELAGVECLHDVDGTSLLTDLTTGKTSNPDRTVFAEYEGEWVKAPTFMARRGRHKYVCTYGADEQLFDLESDPLEGDNRLQAGPDVAEELRQAVAASFDAAAIAADMLATRGERRLMHRAMQQGTQTKWDYRP